MRGFHLFIAALGISGIGLAYSGLVIWVSGTSDLGFPMLLLGLITVYLTQGTLFDK